ncbi:MAG: Abi family protein [Pseudomonadota bacterium]
MTDLISKIAKRFRQFWSNMKTVSPANPSTEPQLWQGFLSDNPTLTPYNKPYLNPQALVSKMAGQGLKIKNSKASEKIIYRNNYFRFKAYAIPFIDLTTKKYHVGVAFDDIENLYLSDQRLREFVFSLIGELEIRIRSTVDNVVTSATGDPFWHIDRSLFDKYEKCAPAIKKANGRFQSSQLEYALHYKNRYYTPRGYEDRKTPPFWILSEILTIEHLLSIANALSRQAPPFLTTLAGDSKLNKCARDFGFNSYDTLMTNLQCLLELRNICAHHSRLWNRNLQAPKDISKKVVWKPTHSNRLYSALVMLRIMCKEQGIQDNIQATISSLFAATPVFARDMHSIGFPAAWQTDPIWG